ncbi:MAG: threonine synthase [Acidimicrobiia bacterium]|jgi:threonine synthase|nr:threonine synthase [Acidimicrobiia bacterium]
MTASGPVASFNPEFESLTCFDCGAHHEIGRLHSVCESCGLPLQVNMRLKPDTDPASVIDRSIYSLWRYSKVLPVLPEAAITLTEGWTPLVQADGQTWVKDEARNPTGSFKARGMSMGVSAAVALGARRLVAPSAGNAAGALAAYGAAAGVEVLVAMPEDTPRQFVEECRQYGAQVELVPGTIADSGRWLAEHRSPDDFDLSTLKEPFRVEGKKTMGYELWEQFDGDLPDVIVYPTGGGTGLVGMWKAFDEMEAMGWIGATRPRLVSVQSDGCAPVVEGFRRNNRRTEPWPDARTTAYGLRVPNPIAGFICLRALRETGGTAIAVPESDIEKAAAALSAATGVDACPEAGAAWAAHETLRDRGWIGPEERTLVFNTGTGLKYR